MAERRTHQIAGTTGSGYGRFEMQNRKMFPERHAGGREPTADSTLAGLDDALASLERRMSKLAAARSNPPARREPDVRQPHGFADDLAEIVRRQRALERETAQRMHGRDDVVSQTGPSRPAYSSRPSPGPLPQRGSAKAGSRRESQDMTVPHDALVREMASMREEIARLRESAAPAPDKHLAAGLERMSRDVARLAAAPRGEDYAGVRGEIEQLRHAVERMAREDSIQELTERWQVLERFMGEQGEVLQSSSSQTSERLAQLADHVNVIRDAVSAFPEADALAGIEARIATLAGSIERVADRRDVISPESIYQIEERLDEISRALIAVSVSNAPATVDNTPFERIEARIGSLARQIDEIASERTEAALADRIEGRIADLARQIDQVAGGPGIEATNRIEERVLGLASRIDAMAPQNASEHHARLETMIADLAGQIDLLSSNGASDGSADRLAAVVLDLVERIDAMGAGAAGEDASIGRIEVIIDDLRRQIEIVAQDRGGARDADRLEAKIAELAASVHAMGDMSHLGALSDTIGAIHEQLDAISETASRTDPNLLQIVERLNDLADRLDRGDGPAPTDSLALTESLNARFEDLSALIEARASRSAAATERMTKALTDKVEELAHRIDAAVASGGSADLTYFDQKLDELAARFTASEGQGGAFSGLRDIEEQIASIAGYLQNLPQAAGDGPVLGDRLAAIENHLLDERDRLVEAACQAAREAVAAHAAGGGGIQASGALGDELRQLEDIARASDQRNANTFGAIHDTLLKVVEKLAGIEARIASGEGDALAVLRTPRPVEPKPTVAAAPPIDMADDPLVADAIALNEQLERAPRSPAEAAAAAARAAMDNSDRHPRRAATKAKQKSSLLGGLTKALRIGKAAPVEKGVAARLRSEPAMASAAVDIADSDTPLEPGSGAPDLSQIMRRVREEKRQADRPAEAESGKDDFIAAARRAAQAAAAEAAILKSDNKSKKRGATSGAGFGKLFSGNRKMLAIGAGAVILAVLAVPAVMSLVGGGQDEIRVAVRSEQSAEPTSAVADAAPVESVSIEPGDDADTPGTEPANPMIAGMQNAGGVDAEATPLASASLSPATTTPDITAPAMDVPAAADIPIPPVEAGPVALREAAAKGDPVALFAIAERYTEGKGVGADFKEAAKWYRLSADSGYAPAQYRLGTFHEKGFGVDQSVAEAKTWYQLAAEQGNANAMHNLAVLHAMGIEGTPDNESAVAWFRKAANLGVKDSQYNLAILTAKGLGTPQDLAESYKWFALAAKAGDPDAASKRDEVAKAMQPDQLDSARASADLWKPSPLVEGANAPDIPAEWTESSEQTAALEPGVDMQKATRNIQLILNKAGYDAGPADGVMGEKTRQAIRAFQKAAGMPESGEVDQALVDALLKLNNT